MFKLELKLVLITEASVNAHNAKISGVKSKLVSDVKVVAQLAMLLIKQHRSIESLLTISMELLSMKLHL